MNMCLNWNEKQNSYISKQQIYLKRPLFPSDRASKIYQFFAANVSPHCRVCLEVGFISLTFDFSS